MGSSSFDCVIKELEKDLVDTGNSLLKPPSSIDELLHLLDKAESLLSKVGQDPPFSIQNAMLPLIKALIAKSLLSHSDIMVKVSVASCISEVCRITAPVPPYSDEVMKEIFQLVVMAFAKLSDASGRCYPKAVNVLQNAAKVRFCVLLLDLECVELVIEIFHLFLSIIRLDHPYAVYKYMEEIMTWIMEEIDEISLELLRPILASLKRENQNASPICSKLGAKVLRNCAATVKPYLREAVRTMNLNLDDYAEIIATICEDARGRKNVEGEDFPRDARYLVSGGLSTDGLSKSLLGDGKARLSSSNNIPNKDISFRKRADQRLEVMAEKLYLTSNVQPEDDAGDRLRERAPEEPVSSTVAVKMEEKLLNEVEIGQGQLLQKGDGTKQTNDISTSEQHGIHEVRGEVSVSAQSLSLVAKDRSCSHKSVETKSRRRRGPEKKEVLKKRRVIKHYGEELVGSKVQVWWPLDQRFYEGVILSYDSSNKKHKVLYADGDEENLNLSRERWELVQSLSDQDPKVDVQSPYSKKRKKAKVKSEPATEEENTIVSPARTSSPTAK